VEGPWSRFARRLKPPQFVRRTEVAGDRGSSPDREGSHACAPCRPFYPAQVIHDASTACHSGQGPQTDKSGSLAEKVSQCMDRDTGRIGSDNTGSFRDRAEVPR